MIYRRDEVIYRMESYKNASYLTDILSIPSMGALSIPLDESVVSYPRWE